MKTCLSTIVVLLLMIFAFCVPACALIVVVPETEDGLKISNVEVHPLPDHFLERCADTIPDKEQTMTDLVKCFFLVNAIQEYYPGGIERSKLETYIDFVEIDDDAIVEDSDALVLNFSDHLLLSFQFDDDSHDLITQATITIIVEDIDLHSNIYYPIIVQF